MMMADTLKDFLVGIGFKVDAASQARAEAAVTRTETKNTSTTETESSKRIKLEEKEQEKRDKARRKSDKDEQERQAKSLKDAQSFVLKMSAFAIKAAATVEASAVGIVYAVDKAAKSFDRLNYMSQRTGSSPGRIGAFGYASSQLGSSAEEANSSLEAFGQKLRINGSGYGQALERLGIKTRDANGHLRDSAELATDLGDALRRIQQSNGKYGYANAVTQASVFGFDENTTRALMNPDFRKREGQYRSDQKAIGADPDAAAKTGTAFEQSMRRLDEVLDQIGTKIDGVLFVKLKPLLDQLADWFAKNGDRIADIVSRVADDLVKLAAAIGDKIAGADWNAILGNIEYLAKGFDALAKRLTGDDGLTALFGLFGATLAIKVLSPLAQILASLRLLGLVALPPWLAGMLAGGAAAGYAADKAIDFGVDKPEERRGVAQMQAQIELDKHHLTKKSTAGRAYNWVKGKLGFGDGSPTGNDALWARGRKAREARNAAHGYTGTEAAPIAPGGFEDKAPGVMSRLKGDFDLGDDDAAAVLGNLGHESTGFSAYNEGGGGPGIGWAQWTSADRKAGFLKYAKDHNLDPRSDEANYGYLRQELKTNYAGAVTAVKNANGLENKTVAFERAYEGAGVKAYGSRFAYARRALNASQAAPKKIPPMLRQMPMASAPNPYAGYTPGKPLGLIGGGYMATPLGDTAALHTSIMNSSKGDTNITHNPTFNIKGGDAQSNLVAVRMAATRGQQDLLRNVQGMEQ